MRSASLLCAMYGRRPRCKGKESGVSAKRSGAAMYPGTGRLSKCAWSIVRRRRRVVLTVEENKYVTDGRHGFGGLTS